MNREQQKYHGLVPLNEMAYSISGYRNVVMKKSLNILVNYCLVVYAGLDKNYRNLRNHWKSELKRFMTDLCNDKLSKKDTAENREKYIREYWIKSDYNQADIVRARIGWKFDEENIDLESDKFHQCSEIFVERFDEIISIIASGNEKSVVEYIKNM